MAERDRSKPLRIGLLVDAWDQHAWAYRMLETICASDCVEVALVVMNRGRPARQAFLRRIWDNRGVFLYRVYTRLEERFCKPRPNAFEPVDSQGLLKGVPVVEVVPEQTGPLDDLGEADAEKIRAYDLDVAIRMGFRTMTGNLLKCARHGVWALDHGDNLVLRGEPPCFWELFEGHPTTGSILHVLDGSVRGGLVLARSWSATNKFSVRNCESKCYWKAQALFSRKLRELHELGAEEFFRRAGEAMPKPGFYDRPLYRRPTNWRFLRAFTRRAFRTACSILAGLFHRETWLLLYRVGKGLSTDMHAFDGRIAPPGGMLYADPHVVRDGDRYHVFFEVSPCSEERGHIAVVTIDAEGNCTEPAKVLECAHHLAYPLIVEWEGAHYMVPDSGMNGTVDAYRCDDMPIKWSFHKTLMKDVSAVDPTLFQHGGKWWMFLSMKEHEGCSFSDELFLFHADSPLSDAWVPHPMNPIVSDARRARPAGKVLEHEGKLYRLSQNCTRGYGYCVNLHEIVALDEETYREEDCGSIEPLWDPRFTGLHTLAHAGDLTVVDVRERRPRWL